MPKLTPLWVTQLFDNEGVVLADGLVYTYAGGTSTPIATYTDAGGLSTNLNPVELDSAGRADIWITEGVAYKFILKDGDGNTLETADGIILGEPETEIEDDYEVLVSYIGTPGAQGWMGGLEAKRAITFPIDLEGSGGSVVTTPASTFEIAVKKNGTQVATVSISTGGVFTLTTVGGTTFSLADGDTLDLYAPDTVGTAANIKITLVGTLA